MGSQRVGHDCVAFSVIFIEKIILLSQNSLRDISSMWSCNFVVSLEEEDLSTLPSCPLLRLCFIFTYLILRKS